MAFRIFIFFLILIPSIIANVLDFDNLLHHGATHYIQSNSGFLFTVVMLIGIPTGVLEMTGAEMYIFMMILEGIYITFYTRAYLRIREKVKEENRKFYEEIVKRYDEERKISDK